jgi:hypothetical protein
MDLSISTGDRKHGPVDLKLFLFTGRMRVFDEKEFGTKRAHAFAAQARNSTGIIDTADTAFAVIIAGAVLSFVWPPIDRAIDAFSRWAVHERPALAFTIYVVVERALIPFGLHHV